MAIQDKTFFQSNWKNILLIIFSCIIVVLLMSTTCTKQKLDIANNNIAALTDSIHTYQLKNGELMYEKQGYVLEKEELEKYLEISKGEVKDLEKKLTTIIDVLSKILAKDVQVNVPQQTRSDLDILMNGGMI